jgi:hypothetical protein
MSSRSGLQECFVEPDATLRSIFDAWKTLHDFQNIRTLCHSGHYYHSSRERQVDNLLEHSDYYFDLAFKLRRFAFSTGFFLDLSVGWGTRFNSVRRIPLLRIELEPCDERD